MTKHTKKEQKEAAKRVREISNQIKELTLEAEDLCDEHGIFDFVSYPEEYGMGGRYRPNPKNVEQWAGKPEDYDEITNKVDDDDENSPVGEWHYEYNYEGYGDGEGYWHTSSMSC